MVLSNLSGSHWKKDSFVPPGYMSVSASVLPDCTSVKGGCKFIILHQLDIGKEKTSATRQLGIMPGQSGQHQSWLEPPVAISAPSPTLPCMEMPPGHSIPKGCVLLEVQHYFTSLKDVI